MDLDTLYKYLKLVVPSDLMVEKREFGIHVGVDLNSRYGTAYSDSYSIRDNYIVLFTLRNTIPKYAQKIFGRPALIDYSYLNYFFFFNIPKELKED